MPEPTVETIRCRYPGWTWVAVAIFGGMGVVSCASPFLAPRSPEPAVWVVAGLIGVFFLGFAGWGGVSTARSEIVADAEGLSWRGIGKWRRAHWADVTDYFDRLGDKSQRWSVVQTRAGSLKFDRSYTRYGALREAICQRATGTKVRDWGLEGTRLEEDSPQRFTYQRIDVIAMGVASLGSLWMIGYFGWRLPGKTVEFWNIHPALGIAFLAMTAFLFTAVPGLMLWLFLGFSLPGWRKHGRDEIVLDREGFRVRTHGRECSGKWTDVVCYRQAPWGIGSRRIVETRVGTWEFNSSIGHQRLLLRLLERLIPAKAQAKAEDDETLGGEAGRWTSGCRGVGRRVFHYRTSTNRALLWMAALPAGLGALCLWLSSQDLLPQPAATTTG
jgi:hypothetical protein